MKKWIGGWLEITLAVLACVGISGCGNWFEEDGTRVFADHFGSASIVGFVDDSLVIVADDKSWSQNLSDGTDFVGHGHQRLRVFNYRVQEDNPRWTDTLDNFTDEFDYVKGQVSDSVIWGAHGDGLISFWKLGEEPVVHRISVKMDGCNQKFAIRSMRNWIDGLIWVSGIFFYGQRTNDLLNAERDTCQYAVLDTVAKTIIYKRLADEWKWIGDCDDVMAQKGNVYCLALERKKGKSFIMKNGKDSVFAPREFAVGGFWGNMIKLSGNICSMKNDEITCSGVIWYGNGLTFYQNGEVVVDLE